MNNPLAICQEMFGDKSFVQVCKIISEYGYDGIELAPFKNADDIRTVQEKEIVALKQTAEDFGLEFPAFHWLLVSPNNMHISCPDNTIVKETREFFRGLIDFSQKLGVKILVFGSPKQRSIDESWDYDSAYERGVYFFQEMGDNCKNHDIVIAFEPLGKQITNFGGDFTDAQQLLKDIAHSNVKMLLE